MDKINENSYLYQQTTLANKNTNIKNSNIKKKTNQSQDIKEENSFLDILKNEEQNSIEADILKKNQDLQNLLKDIGKKGEQLKKSLNFDTLDEYKKLVKTFLNSALNISEQIEKKCLWNRIRKEKVTKVHLTVVDKELHELTKYFFEEQKDVFKIASRIDKIEGLLVDIAR